MSNVYTIQSNFQSGELSPRLHSRVDSPLYKQGAGVATNMQVLPQGGLRKRSGTRFVAESLRNEDNGNTILIPFVFSQDQSYVLELSGYRINNVWRLRMRFYTRAGVVTKNGVPYEIDHPFGTAILNQIDYVQSADVMYFVHEDVPPQKLTRHSETDWRWEDVEIEDGPWMDLYSGTTTNTLTYASRPQPGASRVANSITVQNQNIMVDFNKHTRAYLQADGWIEWNWSGAGQYKVTGFSFTSKKRTGTDDNDYASATTPFQFRLDGWSSTQGKWVAIHKQTTGASWGAQEERAWFWSKKLSQRHAKHRLVILNSGSESCEGSMVKLRFADVANQRITFDNTAGINDGAGFNNDDVGRFVRWRTNSGYWNTLKISKVENNRQVVGVVHAMQQDGNSPTGVLPCGSYLPSLRRLATPARWPSFRSGWCLRQPRRSPAVYSSQRQATTRTLKSPKCWTTPRLSR